jgi:hypothetical protein
MIRLGCCNRDRAFDGGELIGVDETRVCEVSSINTLIEVSNEVLDTRLAKVPDFPWSFLSNELLLSAYLGAKAIPDSAKPLHSILLL